MNIPGLFFGARKLAQDTERNKVFSEATERGYRHTLVGLALLAAVAFPALEAAAQGTWTPTGSMAAARRDHTATLLNNGKVLIAGGTGGSPELYDPATGTFSPTGSSLGGGFSQGATATRLLDGRVLLIGGSPAEIYDPSSGTFSQAGTLSVGRVFHTATLLPDGKVLIAAGQNASATATHSSAELFDPTTNTFTLTGNLNIGRSSHTAILLPDGKVLVAGGGQITVPGFSTSLSSAELFDPVSGTFNPTGNMTQPRCCIYWTQPQILDNGKVFIFGGLPAPSGELFDPATQTFSATGPLNTPRAAMSATLLLNGQVLIAGGFADAAESAEMYNPATNAFTPIASMNQARQQHTATLLSNGQVLVTGGFDFEANEDLNSAELFSSIVTVTIDIQPGIFPNSINLRSRGKLPVAILTTDVFDATTVDPTTVLFGRTGIEAAPVHAALEDINRDGKLDLVVQFNIQAADILCGDASASLTGNTRGGQAISGSDSIQTKSCK
jgi:hypothetical protein